MYFMAGTSKLSFREQKIFQKYIVWATEQAGNLILFDFTKQRYKDWMLPQVCMMLKFEDVIEEKLPYIQ